METSKHASLRRLAWAAWSFTLLAATVIGLTVMHVVTFQLGLLMLVGLVGLYFGLGVLVLVYRFVAKLS
jgi:hypothetical protein